MGDSPIENIPEIIDDVLNIATDKDGGSDKDEEELAVDILKDVIKAVIPGAGILDLAEDIVDLVTDDGDDGGHKKDNDEE